MPRVHVVKSARKPQPHAGIEVGDSYYWWKFRFGGKHVSKTRPSRSQLTQSDFFSQMYAIEDDTIQNIETAEDIRNVIDELETLRDETQEKFDNMPDSLQYGSTGELLESRVEGCEEMINELDNCAMELEDKEGEMHELTRPEEPGEEPDDDDSDEWSAWERATEEFEEYEREKDELESDLQSIVDEARNVSYQGE